MSTKMTRERAEEFGASWNSRDDDLVASFFAEDGEWDFVSTDPTGQQVRTAGCDLLQFVGDKVVVKNAFANGGHRG
jgi:hypothetical protein